jgi:hypothetical protein
MQKGVITTMLVFGLLMTAAAPAALAQGKELPEEWLQQHRLITATATMYRLTTTAMRAARIVIILMSATTIRRLLLSRPQHDGQDLARRRHRRSGWCGWRRVARW